MYHNLYNHSPVEGQLGYFQFLPITSKVTINIYLCVKINLHSFLWVKALESNTRFHDNCMFSCMIIACLVMHLLKLFSKTILCMCFWEYSGLGRGPK